MTTAATSIKRRAIGRYLHQLAEPPHGVGVLLRYDETATAHWSGVRAITRRERLLAPAFFNMSSSCARRRLAARNWRNPMAVARSGSTATEASASYWHWWRHLGSIFRAHAAVWVERLSLARRSASARQAASQCRRLAGGGLPFMTAERLRPYSVRFYPTTSVSIWTITKWSTVRPEVTNRVKDEPIDCF